MSVIIGVTTGWEPGVTVKGWPSVYVNKHLTDCIYQAGAIPLMIPVTDNHCALQKALRHCDGLIMSGETLSIQQNVMVENETNLLRKSNPIRYDYEAYLIKTAIALQIPVLGICRGFQVMNVELGGEVTDYDINIDNHILHQQNEVLPPEEGAHKISIMENTILQKIVNRSELFVNSYHRQGTVKVAPGFVVSAVSDDGNIEAIESVRTPTMIGVQFHPEMMQGAEFFQIFCNLVQDAAK